MPPAQFLISTTDPAAVGASAALGAVLGTGLPGGDLPHTGKHSHKPGRRNTMQSAQRAWKPPSRRDSKPRRAHRKRPAPSPQASSRPEASRQVVLEIRGLADTRHPADGTRGIRARAVLLVRAGTNAGAELGTF
jgi:hypothetical protein